jgi:carbohydrate-selective porin OprB
VIRLLGYVNHGRMGRYAVATSLAEAQGRKPNIVADDAPGRTKYGVGANAELPIADDGNTGAFARLGWNDGRNESFVFTESDRHASGGAQVAGSHWHRTGDVFGIAVAADGLSHDHRAYLAAGGNGFLLGDGALRYGPEVLTEFYYSARLARFATLSPDLMRIADPGYNRDRGPAVVLSARMNLRY